MRMWLRRRREWGHKLAFRGSGLFWEIIRPGTIQSQQQAHVSFWDINCRRNGRRRPGSALAAASVLVASSRRPLSRRLVMAMLCRLAARGAATKALLHFPKLVPPFLAASAAVRFFGTGGGDASSPPERLALEMIQYALGLARSQKSGPWFFFSCRPLCISSSWLDDPCVCFSFPAHHSPGDSYSHAMLVLEQGMYNLREGGGGAVEGSSSSDNAMGMILLAMSTLLYERSFLFLITRNNVDRDLCSLLAIVYAEGSFKMRTRSLRWFISWGELQ